ncbi:MAG: UDP-N-acetylmuramate dehydrogenase [Parachlamydiaceae bacterium]|nr:UDP-N-acetylmuramate dehydrogenase [Parachlamydiaceae bacterium]
MKSKEPVFSEHILLKDFCTYAIGGPARYFLEIRTIEDMQAAIAFCCSHNIHYFVLGKGSNTLFDDRGYNGCILLNKIDFFEQPTSGTFHVGAGYSFSLLGVQSARQGWSGLEFASGIPGSVGGAVYMNAGANGHETCEHLELVDFVNEEGYLEIIPKQELSFTYRHSLFQKRKGAIVGATFLLEADALARKKQIDIVNYRIKTQPYGDKSAGCVFVNPDCGHAGALIEQYGLKGFSIGGAAVSTLHANFLINNNGASCQDMLDLIHHIQVKIKEEAGLNLETEVRYIPYSPGHI